MLLSEIANLRRLHTAEVQLWHSGKGKIYRESKKSVVSKDER